MAEHVTAREFTSWMELLRDQNKEILAEQKKTNGRVTELEKERAVRFRVTALVSGMVAFVISVAGVVIAYLSI
jgi:hypothetical protein